MPTQPYTDTSLSGRDKLNPIRGLLIEDSATYAEFFALSLRRISNDAYTFAHATTMAEGERLLAENTFDVVVSDLGLPDAQGLETARRTLEAAGDTPVVLLTALRDEAVALQAVELGAEDYIPKGSDAALVYRSLGYAIARKYNRQQLQRMREQAAAAKVAHREAEAKAAMYEDLRVAQAAADAARAEKEEFMASLTHELRTPLHGIISFARLGATQHGVADRQRLGDFFRQIEASGQLLLSLVTDLLDLSKLESGHGELRLRWTSLGKHLEETSSEFYPILIEKNVTLEVQEGAADRCRFDVRLMKQVIRNLLSNALKFSSKGSVIRAGVECEGDVARLWVADQGPGIPDDELDTVFNKFCQSSTTPSEITGTGLGLTICREIVRAHQGRIWAENRVGGGSVFYVEIPAQAEPVPSGC